MTTKNLKLFADDHDKFGQFIDGLDQMSEVNTKSWPKLISEFIDLFYAELRRQKMDETLAAKIAPKLAAVLGHYFGGRVCYIPNGEALKAAIRDNGIFLDYQISNGNISQLARKYRLTDSYVYAIIREQLALHRKRHQPDMFE
ncbi:Mor transcription activator family protein [Orbaceae bacterium ESL0721]|nr:Mor transcription activator family protein [Orbaceae bacterium ESL0721]